MSETNTVQEQVDAFVALPRRERRAAYNQLPEEVQTKAREIIEARRGIAKRVDGRIVHTKDVYVEQIVRMTAKKRDLQRRIEKLPTREEKLKADLVAHYGEEALKEAEEKAAAFLAEVEPKTE